MGYGIIANTHSSTTLALLNTLCRFASSLSYSPHRPSKFPPVYRTHRIIVHRSQHAMHAPGNFLGSTGAAFAND